MEKKTYKTPCMKVRRIACTHMLCISGEENQLRMFSTETVEEANVENEVSQW